MLIPIFNLTNSRVKIEEVFGKENENSYLSFTTKKPASARARLLFFAPSVKILWD